MGTSDNVPNVLSRITELSARYASAQTEVANADGIVLDVVCKVVVTFRHSAHKYANALLGSNIRNIVCDSHHLRVIAKRDFAAIWWKMIGDWVLYDFEEFFLRIG